MAQSKKSARGMFTPIFTVFWLIVIAGGLIGWANANNIKTPADVWNYAKSWSDKADECYGDDPTEKVWVCSGDGTKNDPNPGDGSDPTPKPSEGPIVITDEQLKNFTTMLNKIPIKPEATVPYDRSQWKHWSDLDKNRCNTREDILLSSGKDIKLDALDKCKAISGIWISVYDGKKFTNPSELDIDHVIPLGYAAKHGGQDWTPAKKEIFANDISQLLAVSANSNRSKSDKGPGNYMPSKVDYWCSYAQKWIVTTSKYGIWIENTDKSKLTEALGTC